MISTPTFGDMPLWTDDYGKIRIGKTRVLLELVIHAFQRGETPEDIIDSYSTLTLADVYAVIAYYLRHRDEVDAYMQAADQKADQIQREVEANYPPETSALRARLRARLME